MVADNAYASLTYAVRPAVVAKYVGQLAVVLAALTTAPVVVAFGFGDYGMGLRCLAVLGLLLGVGWPLARLPGPAQIQANEAMVVTALAYVAGPLLMAYPMTGAGLSVGDALFEAVSGITTTGLSTVADIEAMPHSFLFARAWMQWYGGLGIVVLSVALLIGHHAAARRLIDPAGTGENLVATMRLHARRMLGVYVALTALGITVLASLGMGGLASVTHALAAVSTGGFSTYDGSLADVAGWPLRSAVLALALLGAVSLPLYYRAGREGWRRLVADEELRALLAAIMIVTALLLVLTPDDPRPTESGVAHALWMAMSAQTTAGFSTMPVAQLSASAKLVLIGSMSVGGAVGSTAGGVKLLRLLLLLRLTQLLIRRMSMPSHAVAELRLGGRRVQGDEMQRALLLVLTFVFVVFLSWLPFLALGYDPLDALFEVVSATGTVGLSTGITHAGLEPLLKAVLCIDMLLGRLEFIALLVLVYPPTWLSKRSASA